MNQKTNDLRSKILEIMKGKGPITVNDICECSSELNFHRTTAILYQLAEAGIVTKTVKNRRNYFEYK